MLLNNGGKPFFAEMIVLHRPDFQRNPDFPHIAKKTANHELSRAEQDRVGRYASETLQEILNRKGLAISSLVVFQSVSASVEVSSPITHLVSGILDNQNS